MTSDLMELQKTIIKRRTKKGVSRRGKPVLRLCLSLNTENLIERRERVYWKALFKQDKRLPEAICGVLRSFIGTKSYRFNCYFSGVVRKHSTY